MKNGTRDAEPLVLRELRHQEFTVVRLERKVRIKIADNVPVEVPEALISRIERMHLCRECPITMLRQIDKLHPSITSDIAPYNSGRRVGGTIVYDHPVSRQQSLVNDTLDRLLNIVSFVTRRSDKNI